jgi:hypothetical protein
VRCSCENDHVFGSTGRGRLAVCKERYIVSSVTARGRRLAECGEVKRLSVILSGLIPGNPVESLEITGTFCIVLVRNSRTDRIADR